MKFIQFVYASILFVFISCSAQENNKNILSYNIDLEILNNTLHISTIIQAQKSFENNLAFKLDKSLMIKESQYYSIDRTNPEFNILKIKNSKNNKIFKIDYYKNFDIKEDDIKGIHFIDNQLIPIKMTDYFESLNYKIKIRNKSNLYYYTNGLECKQCTSDKLSFVISKEKFTSYKNQKIKIIYQNQNDKKIDYIYNTSNDILKYYNHIFKNDKIDDLTIYINDYYNYSFFSSKNFISIQNIDNEKGNLYLLCHEIAHKWFSKSKNINSNPNAFLNEGFAEYLSYMYYRYKYGNTEFENLIKRKQQEINSLGISNKEISAINKKMDDKIREKLLYVKGALICYEIEKNLGEDEFIIFLNKMNDFEISNLEEFLTLIKDDYGISLYDNIKHIL
ncbi:M1 family aminopeptidase [Empedobacter brevis]|uniref:M1 family aminopeptidase n=1 Tax=Empedobacter brevis TaxID=247 RepID=UPI0039AEAA76